MTFERTRKKKEMRAWGMVWILCGVLLLAFLIILGRGYVRAIFAPLFGAKTAVITAGETIGDRMLRSKRSLVSEIDQLQIQVNELASLRAHLAVVEDENKSLRELFSYYEGKEVASNSQLRAAAVIGKPSQTLYNRIIIDQGSNHSILPDQSVGIHGTTLLGIIREVRPTSSIVELYSSPSFAFDGMIRSSGVTVPVTGDGGGNFIVQVPREITVAENDILTLASNPTMVVGIIKSVTFDARDPFQTVRARTPVNIQELKYVEIYPSE